MRRLLLVAGISLPSVLVAQRPAPPKTCNLELSNSDSTTTLMVKLPSGEYNSYYGRGVRGRCTNSDQRLTGDSLEALGDARSNIIIGNARYTERHMRLTADRIIYYQLDERVVAEGNVIATTDKGTQMRGPRAEYFRALPRLRPLSRMVATGRPATRLSPADAGGGSKDTVHLVADQVINVGDSLVYAGGNVVITRPDLKAVADSATMDSGTEWARLTGRPRVDGLGASRFSLVGRQIDLWSKLRKLQRVLSADSARAVSDEVTLVSDTIDLRLVDQQLSRAFAWGKSRARAQATDRDIVADSIDVKMPGQVLRELRALRKAEASNRTDSTRFVSKENDWLKGDTIVALFDSVRAVGDSTAKPQIRTILANGSASSFYQVPSSQGAKAAPNINYVKGKAITVAFGADRAVGAVSVREQASGVYLELTPPDSIRKDTSATGATGDAQKENPKPAAPASKASATKAPAAKPPAVQKPAPATTTPRKP